MVDQDKKTSQFWVGVQTIVLSATAAGIFLTIGRRDQILAMNSSHIAELREISTDLVRSQVLSEANDQNHAVVLEDLKRRIENLEHRSRD
jgi:hypothetical protein